MERLGRYDLGGVLGVGGAGTVFDAVLNGPGGLRMPVALKVLREGSEELRREARIGGLLRHRHLVDVYEIAEQDGRWFCALELCDGTLEDHLPLPPRAVVEVGLQVCAALQYAHAELGLVHLDLKPANLLLSAGVVKVADLGIARAHGFTQDHRIRGTLGYMPPEQLRGGEVDARADVYALGATLVELATGVQHRASATMDLGSLDTLDRDPAKAFPSPAPPAIPDWLEPVVGRCLADAPQDRWPDMEALAGALRALPVTGAALRDALGLEDGPAAPALRHDTNLGAEPDTFVSREAELAQLASILEDPVWITLKGPAGVGKSRLAAAAARAWRGTHGGQVWRVELGEVRDLDGLVRAVARTLDIPLSNDGAELQVGRALDGRGPMLLVLDDFDRITELSGTVEGWRMRARELRLLVTSREPMRSRAERVIEVGPLGREASVELLVARARRRGVEITDDPDVGRLAQRLDGLPLALELAAGRLGVLSVGEVLERLDLSMLRGGTTDRHGTLRAALDSGWALLSQAERGALAQLSVFDGGFELEAAEAVLSLGDESVLDLLQVLADRSWLSPQTDGVLTILASVQHYASAQLTPEEAAAVEARHGAFFAELGSAEVLAALRRREGELLRPKLTRNLDNLLGAGRRAVARGDAEVAANCALAAWRVLESSGPAGAILPLEQALSLNDHDLVRTSRLSAALGRALQLIGRMDEVQPHLERAIAAARAADAPGLEAAALDYLGGLHRSQGRVDQARAALEAALERFRRVDDRAGEGSALSALANLLLDGGRGAEAQELYERALALQAEVGDRRAEATVFGNLGSLHHDHGRMDAARNHYERSLALYREVGDRRFEGIGLGKLALLHADQGRPDEARNAYEASLAVHREVGNRYDEGVVLGNLGILHADQGRLDQARECYEGALAAHREIGNRRSAAIVMGNLGNLLRRNRQFDEAQSLYEQAIEAQRQMGNRRSQAIATGNLADLDVDRGAFDRATLRYREAIAIAHEVGDRRFGAHAHAQLARVLATQGHLAEATAMLDRGDALIARAGAPPIQASLQATRAEVLWRSGDRSGARQALAQADRIAPKGSASLRIELDRISAMFTTLDATE